MKVETKVNRILNSDKSPKWKFLKLIGLCFELVPGSEKQEEIRILAEQIRKQYNVTF